MTDIRIIKCFFIATTAFGLFCLPISPNFGTVITLVSIGGIAVTQACEDNIS